MPDRYDASSSPEGQYQPGSDEKVLLNKLGISDINEMDNLEFDLLADLQDRLFNEIRSDTQINVKDLCEWHKRWLGSIYDWAGEYRSVNLIKDGFVFAASHLISNLMNDLDNNYLKVYTPCEVMSKTDLVEALSVCHIEFIIIHPFREGNGRLARLLVTVMALQANMPPLDFEIMNKDKERYISAIHAGHSGNYDPMKQLFEEILDYSNRQAYRNKHHDNE